MRGLLAPLITSNVCLRSKEPLLRYRFWGSENDTKTGNKNMRRTVRLTICGPDFWFVIWYLLLNHFWRRFVNQDARMLCSLTLHVACSEQFQPVTRTLTIQRSTCEFYVGTPFRSAFFLRHSGRSGAEDYFY